MKNLSGPRASARGKVLLRKHNPHQRGDHIMPQTLAPFHLEHTPSTGTVTARGGAALLLEAFYATGLHEASRSIRRRPKRGYDDADHVMTAILLNLLGLASCDDVEHLRDGKALGDLCGSMKAHHGSGSRMDSVFPSPSALRKWLHEVGESKASLRSVKELIYGPFSTSRSARCKRTPPLIWTPPSYRPAEAERPTTTRTNAPTKPSTSTGRSTT